MNVRIRVVNNRLLELLKQSQRLARVAVQQEIKAVQKDIRTEMAKEKTGRLYSRGYTAKGKARKPHRASAAGEAPAVDTGALTNSIDTAMTGPADGVVYTNQEYALPLEFGTIHMAARPFMVPAAERARRRFWQRVEDLLKGLK